MYVVDVINPTLVSVFISLELLTKVESCSSLSQSNLAQAGLRLTGKLSMMFRCSLLLVTKLILSKSQHQV